MANKRLADQSSTLDGTIIEETVYVEEKTDPKVYVLKEGPYKGLEIEVLGIDPMKLKKTRDSVKMPKRPTYQTRTVTGKVEEWPLDEVSAEQVPNGKARWAAYKEAREEAVSEQNDKVVQAIFFLGTAIKDDLPTGWELEQTVLGIDIPDHPNPEIAKELKKAHFLATELEKSDFQSLLSAVMRRTGASEEDIQEAEATFRG